MANGSRIAAARPSPPAQDRQETASRASAAPGYPPAPAQNFRLSLPEWLPSIQCSMGISTPFRRRRTGNVADDAGIGPGKVQLADDSVLTFHFSVDKSHPRGATATTSL